MVATAVVTVELLPRAEASQKEERRRWSPGIILRLWATKTLGEYFTTAVQTSADQRVITTGPYRILRHPSYTGILLYAVGSALVVGNWIGLIAMTLVTLVPLVYRIRVEEDALTSTLGEAYRSYASHHRRLIPGIW